MYRHRHRRLVASTLGLLLTFFVPAAPAQARERTGASPADYAREEVRVQSGRVSLAGSLLLPAGEGPHPVALLIPGARDSRFLPEVAEHLAERGIAVLDLQKRGVGGSTGRWERQTFRGRANDVVAGIEFLRSRPEIDPGRIGLVGHSQGGWIAQMVAAEREEVAFVVLLATPGQTVRDQILVDERLHRERSGMPQPQVEREMASLGRQLRLAESGAPLCRALRVHYICNIIGFDPAPFIERMHAPVLALFGELDPMAPPQLNLALIRSGLERAGNPDVTIHVFPQTNHLFWQARTGLRHEYHQLQPVYVSGFLDTVGSWILERVSGRCGDVSEVCAAQ